MSLKVSLKRPAAAAAAVSDQVLTAKRLQEQYGGLLQEQYGDCPSVYLLHSALSRRKPPIDVSMATVKTWWEKYKHGEIQYSVSNSKELQDKYGDIVRVLAVNKSSAYLLVRALRDREPAVYISDEVAKQWFKKYFDLSQIDNAGHLESRYGELLREHMKQHSLDATGVSQWLVGRHQVSVPARICQHWLAKDWSSSGMLMTIEAVEESIGMRLRLDEYRHQLADDASAQELSLVFSESQPAVLVSGLLLRQWYTKYHPDSGPIKYDTVESLEEAQGDHLRSVYPGMAYKVLRTALGMRRKVVAFPWAPSHGIPWPPWVPMGRHAHGPPPMGARGPHPMGSHGAHGSPNMFPNMFWLNVLLCFFGVVARRARQ
jgi:hypothetical protein